MNAVEIIKRISAGFTSARGLNMKLCADSVNPKATTHFRPFFLELEPGQQRGDVHDGHLGRELGIVVNGVGQLIYGGDVYNISDGDALSFSSQIPHVIKNTGEDLFQAYWIVTPADGEDYFGEGNNI